MRAVLFVSLWALWGATCQRVEEPTPPAEPPEPVVNRTSSAPPAPAPTTTSSSSSADAGPCVAPLAVPAPPRAKPAAACPKDPIAAPPVLPLGSVAFPTAKAAPVVSVEIARTSPTVQRGLMYRTSLGPESGMIFEFGEERPRTFWMKNTCIPLDMLFLSSDGTVVGILEEVPVLNEAPRAVPCPAAYVLEVNAGYARRHGLTPGMKTELKL